MRKLNITVELWDEQEDGTETAQSYDLFVEVEWEDDEPASLHHTAHQGFFCIDVLDWNGVDKNSPLAKRILDAAYDLDWADMLDEINDDIY